MLDAEELHAATDLALYTVNTSALYSHAQGIMRQRVKGQFSDRLWQGHAKIGRIHYQIEMGSCDKRMFKEEVIKEAARQIKDHYAEEQKEMRDATN